MTINGQRRFSFNGKKYFIQDLPKADVVDGRKYYITVYENGWWKIAYAFGVDIQKFETIKDAQRYVRDWDFTLETM